jgi:hypothetical protein
MAMTIVNRTVVILEILLLIVLLIVTAVVPNTVVSQLAYTVERAQTALLDWPRSYFLFLLVAIPAIFVLVLLLWLEIRPQTSSKVLVRGKDGTQTEVSTASVAESLRHHIDEIDDVFKVKATVRGKRGGVDILFDLETTPEIDIPAKMAEVSQAARSLIEGKMGLKIADIRVRVKQAPYGGAKKPLAEPLTETPGELADITPIEEPTTDVKPEDTDPYAGF